MRGRFITFEGGEGSGKSTQVATLVKRLTTRGVGVMATREPGGSPGAEAVRHVLRGSVRIYRRGGEEFAMLLETTDPGGVADLLT